MERTFTAWTEMEAALREQALLMVSRRFKSGRIYRIQDALSMLGEYTRADSTGIVMIDEPCE
jgi:hypothetical protein